MIGAAWGFLMVCGDALSPIGRLVPKEIRGSRKDAKARRDRRHDACTRCRRTRRARGTALPAESLESDELRDTTVVIAIQANHSRAVYSHSGCPRHFAPLNAYLHKNRPSLTDLLLS